MSNIIKVTIPGFGYVKTEESNIENLRERYRGVSLSHLKSVLRTQCLERGMDNYARYCKNRNHVFAILCEISGKGL